MLRQWQRFTLHFQQGGSSCVLIQLNVYVCVCMYIYSSPLCPYTSMHEWNNACLVSVYGGEGLDRRAGVQVHVVLPL